MDHFYWRLAGAAVGPILLILGPLLLIRRTWRRPAAVLAAIGCCILTLAASWALIDIALHENASNRAFGFSVAGVIFVVAVVADFAGVRICRVAFRRPPSNQPMKSTATHCKISSERLLRYSALSPSR
jgi:hypothetical protein